MSEPKIITQPTGHHVLIKLDTKIDKTASGFKISDTLINKELKAASKGIVVALGPTAYEDYAGDKPWCKPGDLVLFKMYEGLLTADKNHMMIEDGAIYGIIKK